MNGQHLHAERRCGSDGASDGVGNIVKLKIEKNSRVPGLFGEPDDARSAGGKKFEPQLEVPHPAAEPADQFQGRRLIGYVDGGNNSIFRGGGSCHSLTGMKRVARAKINLSLRILGKRADGFHEIDTLIVPIALADELEFRDAPDFAFTCSDPTLPIDDSNLAVRAARMFSDFAGQAPNVHIHLEKKIPHGAGLGGGSSDAAAVLLALNERANGAVASADLNTIAAQLGSDVPFFLHKCASRCRGRGEIVEPCAFDARYRLLLIKPPFPVPTPWAYQHWVDSNELPGVPYAPQRLAWGELVNDLERPVFEKYLVLATLKTWLLEQPEIAGALMSGSGSTSFALLHSSASIEELERRIRAEFGEDLWYCQTEICG